MHVRRRTITFAGRLIWLLCVLSLTLPGTAYAQVDPPPGLQVVGYLPFISRPLEPYRCPTTSAAQFDAIPYEGAATDRPAELHGDLNLALRSYAQVYGVPLVLVSYDGEVDSAAPQLRGLFADHRVPGLASTYQVHDWNWACGPSGCRGDLLDEWPTTLLGMATGRGESIRAPYTPAKIYENRYIVLVLYAEESRVTLKYTREDNVVTGYTVHIENVCVDPNLLARYRELNAAGRPMLPALRNGEALGTATGNPILVAVRDNGRFLDPRSQKDWWVSFE